MGRIRCGRPVQAACRPCDCLCEPAVACFASKHPYQACFRSVRTVPGKEDIERLSAAFIMASRIGKGRWPSAGSAAAAYPPTTAPAAPAATADVVRTTEASDQTSRSFTQSADKPTALSLALDQTPKDRHLHEIRSSKWGKSSASDSGPVFQVVSRGSRLSTGTPSNCTPPSHPTKTHSTIPRTRSLIPSRGTSSSSSSNASISLRNRGAVCSSSSSSASSMMAFGSRIDRPTGRLPTEATTIDSSTPPAVGNCRSVVRVLSFEETANSPNNSPALKKQGVDAGSTRAAAPAAATSKKFSEPGKSAAEAAAHTDGASLSTAIASSNCNRADDHSRATCATPRLSSDSEPPGLMHSQQLPPARATAAELCFDCGPLPAVCDAVSAADAAKVLLQQLLNSASSLIAAVGLSADSLRLAGLPSNAANRDTDAGQTGEAEQAGSPGDSIDISSSSQSPFAALLASTAVMLESGCSAESVRQAVLPALLLQLAGLACHHSTNSGQNSTADSQDTDGLVQCAGDSGSAAAAAASALRAGVQAGITAARASMLVPGSYEDSAAVTHDDNPAADVGVEKRHMAISRRIWGSSRGWGRKVLVGCLLMFWSMALLTAGFIVAVVWTILEGGSAWVPGSASSGAVSSSNAAEWPVEWLYDDWAASWTWNGAVLPGRRFVS